MICFERTFVRDLQTCLLCGWLRSLLRYLVDEKVGEWEVYEFTQEAGDLVMVPDFWGSFLGACACVHDVAFQEKSGRQSCVVASVAIILRCHAHCRPRNGQR